MIPNKPVRSKTLEKPIPALKAKPTLVPAKVQATSRPPKPPVTVPKPVKVTQPLLKTSSSLAKHTNLKTQSITKPSTSSKLVPRPATTDAIKPALAPSKTGGLFTQKPSDRLGKGGDPYSKSNKNSSQLAVMYHSGQCPCHVDYHGSKLRLTWKGGIGPEEANFESVLIAFVDGLTESKHPLSFIAQQGIKDILSI